MQYYFNKTLHVWFDDAVTHVVEALKKEGFGVLADIDVEKTLKKKFDVDFRKYRILGDCNPPFAVSEASLCFRTGHPEFVSGWRNSPKQ